jgi:hypothetical protein
MVQEVERYTEFAEVYNVLVWRDSVGDAIARGEALVPEAERALAEADETLRRQAPELARRWPGLFDGEPGRDGWWWSLSCGPTVRR